MKAICMLITYLIVLLSCKEEKHAVQKEKVEPVDTMQSEVPVTVNDSITFDFTVKDLKWNVVFTE